MRIFSSAEYCLRVARRMSRTRRSDGVELADDGHHCDAAFRNARFVHSRTRLPASGKAATLAKMAAAKLK